VNKGNSTITVVTDSNAIGQRACQLFLADAWHALTDRGKFFVAISGGRSPVSFFARLAADVQSRGLEWTAARLFWVDERCVPPDSPDSNYRLAQDSFIQKVGIPRSSVFRIHAEADDPDAEAQRYETVIRNAFDVHSHIVPPFDLMVMGMGADGHTASLFPGSDVIIEKDRLARAVRASGKRLARITLTPPVLAASRHIIVLVSGSDKAEVLANVLTLAPDPMRYPVQLLLERANPVTWLVDKAAALKLPPSICG